MTTSTPFIYVRQATLVARPSTPFRYVRQAALVPRHSAPFIYVRNATLPDPAGTPFRYLRGAPPPFSPNLIRGPQFQSNTIAGDRFVNRLTSVIAAPPTIDLINTGTTTLYTVPSGKIALIQGLILRVLNGSAFTDATVSLGINPSTTDFFDEQELVNFRVTNDVWSLWSDKSTTLIAQSGAQIDLEITVAATGGPLNANVYLIGFLI